MLGPGLDRFRTGLLVGLAPAVVVAAAVAASAGSLPFGWSWREGTWAALGAAALQVVGALLAGRWYNTGRTLWTAAWVSGGLLIAPWLLSSPAALLMAAVVMLGMLAMVWDWTHPDGGGRRYTASGALGAWLGALIVGAAVLATDLESVAAANAVTAAATAVAAFAWRPRGNGPQWRRYLLSGALVLAPTALALLAHRVPVLVAVGAIGIVTPVVFATRGLRRVGSPDSVDWAELLLGEPGRSMVLTFVLVGSVGGAVLSLPVAAADGRTVSLLDGLFTAFSAVCVTGLIVLDTPNDFSGVGQVVILLLIQVGGLGIMTFSVASLAILGRRLRVSQERAAAELLGTEDRAQIRTVLRSVLRVTLWSEGAGALALAIAFAAEGDSPSMAVWRGLFTSISAFCNAGFALQTDSLVPYQENPFVLLTVAGLITLGGLGPMVVLSLRRAFRRQRISLHVRLVLVTSAVLVAVSFLFIAAAEWRDSLAGLGPGDRLVNALFQAVTLRTAGFNSVDMTALVPATVTLMMVMMFIGGSPGSTAGGVKTTTAAVLFLVVRAALRGERRSIAGGFRISTATVYEATAVFAMGLSSALAAILVLQLTQEMAFEVLAFEAFSALGTVGLSTGGTALLDSVGKVLIIAAMFAGRVGPLTLFFFLSRRVAVERAERPEREVPVG